MVRVGISLYLMLIALVGPGLCCCTIMRASGCGCSASTTQAKHEHHRACCHRHESAPKPETPKRQDQPSCPCKEHSAIPVALLRSDLEGQDQFKGSLELGLSFDVSALTTAVVLTSAINGQSLLAHARCSPFDSPAEILCALSVLRC